MKLSDLTPQQWFWRLNAKRIAGERERCKHWAYYDGKQPMHFVARIIEEQQNRFPALRINWSALVSDALEERLDIDGFRIGDADSADDDLEGTWNANRLRAASSEAHVAALVTSEAYLMVGPGDGRYPLITVEYPDQMVVERDSRTGQVIAALKVWQEQDFIDFSGARVADRAVLYLPGRMIEFDRGAPVGSQPTLEWTRGLEYHQSSPLVPVVPLTNRPRRGVGTTELRDIMDLHDGINQTATNMLAGLEHHALPRKWAIGAAEKDFQDKNGKPLPTWAIATGAIWALSGEDDDDNKNMRVGQFSAADMSNFHNSIRQLASMASALYGLPPQYMGYFADNPASADAIKASEARLVKRAERRQTPFGDAWETTMRIALAVMGRDPSQGDRMETVWRDPATPTRAQAADEAVKLHAEGIIDTVLAQERVGVTAAQRRAMERRRGEGVVSAAQAVERVRQLQVGAGAGVNNTGVNGAVLTPA